MAAKRRKKKRKQQRSSPVVRTFKGLYITLVVLSAIVVGLWAVYQVLSQKPTFEGSETPPPPSSNVVVVTDDPDTEDNESQYLTRKKDTWTFLLVAKDQVSGSTDTIMVCTYDTANQQIGLVSIPRDTLVVREGWRYRRINAAYASGGMEELKAAVSQILGIPIDHHVLIDTKIFVELIDAVGGVEFDVPVHMAYDDPYQDLHIHFNKGMQKLNGQKAMELLRYRKDNKRADGTIAGYDDIGRMNTQRDFLKAMAKKVLQLGNITKIGEFIDIFMENVETDLTLTEMMWFASKAISVDVDAMQSSTLPYIDVGHYRKGDYLFPNGEEIVPLVNEQFNPYNREITLSDLQILVRNKDGSCYVTSGELLATAWATPTSSGSSGSTGGGVSTTTPTGITADPNVPTNQQPETPEPPSEPELPPDQVPPDEGTDNPSVAPDPDATPDNPDAGTPPATDPGTTPDTPPAETPAPEPSPGDGDAPVTGPDPADPSLEEPPQEEPPEPVLPPDPVLPPE